MRTRELTTFLIASYLLAWLVASPLWFTGFHRDDPATGATPLVHLCLFAMMLVPAGVAIALTARRHRWRDVPVVLGLRPTGSPGRLAAQVAAAVVIFGALTAAGMLLASAVGWYRPEWPANVPIPAMLMGALLAIPLYLGEEIGWQGYMLPRLLLRFGTVRGVALGGVFWGLWHLPMTALGGSYPGHPLAVAVPAAVVSAVLIGAIIAWIRLRTGSVWPAVAAHLGLNEVAIGLPRLFAGPAEAPDPLLVGPLSITTWPVLLLVVAVLTGIGSGLLAYAKVAPAGVTTRGQQS
jgi:uncharacterized protein